MADDKKKVTKYIVPAIIITVFNLFLIYRKFSLGFLLTSACFIITIWVLFHYLAHRKEYEDQGKDTLLEKTKIFYLQMGSLYVIYAGYKIYETGNWRLFLIEGAIITSLFFINYLKLK